MFRSRHALMFQLLAVILVWRLLTLLGSPAAAPLPPEADARGELVRLPGHVLPALTGATPVAPTPGAEAEPLTLTVVLKRTDQAGFDRYLHEVYDPHSPQFRHFLSQGEITGRFGPTQEAYEGVLAYLQQNGFTLVHGSANRMTLTVRGTRAQAARAFGVHIGDFEAGGRRFFANDSDPAVPTSLAADIAAVMGLSSRAKPKPAAVVERQIVQGQSTLPVVVSESYQELIAFERFIATTGVPRLPAGFSTGALQALGESFDVAVLSVVVPVLVLIKKIRDPEPATGAGQKIGLLAFSSFKMSDVADWLALVGFPASRLAQVSQVDVNGGAPLGSDEGEVLLGIETGLSIAPGAQVVVYDGPFMETSTSFQTLFNAMINDGITVISNSWTYCEDQTTLADVQSIDAILLTAAASGISVFNATGDAGSACRDGSANTIAVPADSPHATAVGGTSLMLGPGFTYGGESWWDGSNHFPPTGQGGFGVSRFFTRPAYQDSLISVPMRSVPDVVAPADPEFGAAVCEADAGGCPHLRQDKLSPRCLPMA
jgi:kumamolisin